MMYLTLRVVELAGTTNHRAFCISLGVEEVAGYSSYSSIHVSKLIKIRLVPKVNGTFARKGILVAVVVAGGRGLVKCVVVVAVHGGVEELLWGETGVERRWTDGVKSGGEGKVGGSFNTHKKTKKKGGCGKNPRFRLIVPFKNVMPRTRPKRSVRFIHASRRGQVMRGRADQIR
jgi:hypothetical protein